MHYFSYSPGAPQPKKKGSAGFLETSGKNLISLPFSAPSGLFPESCPASIVTVPTIDSDLLLGALGKSRLISSFPNPQLNRIDKVSFIRHRGNVFIGSAD